VKLAGSVDLPAARSAPSAMAASSKAPEMIRQTEKSCRVKEERGEKESHRICGEGGGGGRCVCMWGEGA
jgi:hypothetical protein